MKFDLTAAKAYVGMSMTAVGVPLAHWLIGLVDSATGLTLPVTFETFVATVIGGAMGYVAVFLTPNKAAV